MTDRIASAADELSPELVRARFAAARRNGFPAWLWPDIAVAEWRQAVEEIASVTRRILAGEANLMLVGNDARTMGIAAYTSGMGPLLGYWIENGVLGATAEVERILRLHLAHNRRRMTQLCRVACALSEKLGRAGIASWILKGMHTAFCYFPEPGVRPLSDIDIYVPQGSMPAAENILSELGYEQTLRTRSPYACDWTVPSMSREPRTLVYLHQDDPWSLDVQATLDRRLPTGAQVRLDKLLPGCKWAAWPPCPSGQVMRQPLLTLYLAAHTSQILLNTTVLRLLELALVIRDDRASGALDWQEFLNGAEAIGGARFVLPALALCEQLVPETIPIEVLAAAEADAPANLREVVARLSVASAQPLDRHSVSERFMWAANWRERMRQVAGELAFDVRGRPLGEVLYSTGTKLWALRRRRYSA